MASLPCRICSSEKFLSFLVAILGPMAGPVYSACFWVVRPREYRHSTTWTGILKILKILTGEMLSSLFILLAVHP